MLAARTHTHTHTEQPVLTCYYQLHPDSNKWFELYPLQIPESSFSTVKNNSKAEGFFAWSSIEDLDLWTKNQTNGMFDVSQCPFKPSTPHHYFMLANKKFQTECIYLSDIYLNTHLYSSIPLHTCKNHPRRTKNWFIILIFIFFT